MKGLIWRALVCASAVAVASPQAGYADGRGNTESGQQARGITAGTPAVANGGPAVQLTLDTPPISAEVAQGNRYTASLRGTWQAPADTPVYLQASDDSGTFDARAPSRVPRWSTYNLGLPLQRSKAPGVYTGTLTIRACADMLCANPYPDTTHSIGYTLTIKGIGDWGTLQRSSRHDGYVPIQVTAARYRTAWTWQRPTQGMLSPVVTDGANVYFSEPGTSASVHALRASDGEPQWRRVFTSAYGGGPALAPPTVSGGHVYAATTGHQDTWLYVLRAADGLQVNQGRFSTQWAQILNPTVHNGKAYVNAGYYTGEVYAFDATTGAAAWNTSAGTYGMNTPAVDDDFVYSYNSEALKVLNAADGSLWANIGANPQGTYADYNATPMLGSADHVMVYRGSAYSAESAQRQLVNYSVAERAQRWMSISLYSNYPAVAKGVVYATSNETRRLDALDEATGRRLWSWTPGETAFTFTGNVVVTDNLVFVSTRTRIYAIDLRRRHTAWSAATPGTMALSSDGMLFVTTPSNLDPSGYSRITAYRFD